MERAMMTESRITRLRSPHEIGPAEIAALATGLDKDQLDEAVQAVPAELVPQYLYMRDRAVTMLNALGKALTTRMVVEQRLGENWTAPDGKPWRFEAARRGEYEGIPELLYVLNRLGISVTDLGRAVSGLRVGDLETAIASLPEDVREEAAETAKAARVWKDSTPKLTPLEHPYRQGKASK